VANFSVKRNVDTFRFSRNALIGLLYATRFTGSHD
jgi:hypothetical protein